MQEENNHSTDKSEPPIEAKNGAAQSEIPASPWIRASHLPQLFCSWDLAYRCVQSGWLKPVVQGKRRTIYRFADVLSCMRRIEAGEMPHPRGNIKCPA